MIIMQDYYLLLLQKNKEKIDKFFSNVTLQESQFKYSEINEKCYDVMYKNNHQESIKTMNQIFDEIPEIKNTCGACKSYYFTKRNNSIKGLDVQLGRFLEDILIDFFNSELGIKTKHGDNSNKRYPDCMILKNDNQVVAYFEVKYHCAPFLSSATHINRSCYEGSATLDFEKIVKQIEVIESDLDRPTFYLHWIDYPCLKGLFFETSEQVKDYIYSHNPEFDRKEREGDYVMFKKVGYTKKIYSPLLTMGDFNEFIKIITEMTGGKIDGNQSKLTNFLHDI